MLKRLIKLKLSTSLRAADVVTGMVRRLVGLGPANRCVVLYYHGVTDAQRHRFAKQMRWLASHVEMVPIERLGHTNGPGRRCCVTFDDAFDSVRRNALPICRELGMPFSIYAVTGNLGANPRWAMPPGHCDANEPIMTGAQLRSLPEGLVTIGSHTVTHRPLAELSHGEIATELVDSKRELESVLGRPVRELSVPYGSFREDVLVEAARAGYEHVLTCEPDVLTLPQTDARVGRFKVTPDDWMIEFKLAALGAYRWRKWLRGGGRKTAPKAQVPGSRAAGIGLRG